MTVPDFSPPIWGLIFALSGAVVLWLLSLRLRDVSIVDIFWGPGIAGVVDIAAALGHASGPRAAAVLLLVNLWGVRLAAHIWTRHRGEDHRYGAMRIKFGPNWWWISLIQVFLLQAILIWFVPAPLVTAVLFSHRPMLWLDHLGIALAALGLAIEALSDFQLASFRMDPANKGKVMDKGLWGWSRHPNYFGELSFWWGLMLFGLAAAPAQWWWIVPGALAMSAMFLFASIPLMDTRSVERRPAYREHMRKVSALLPLPPRS